MYDNAVKALGHEVLASYRNVLELVLAIPGFSVVPDLIITDTVDTEDLVRVYAACKSRAITVPFIVISKNLQDLRAGVGNDCVFGICNEPLDFDSDVLRAMLLIATTRFACESQLRLQANKAQCEAEDVKTITRACALMCSYGKAKTPVTARRVLERIAASHNRRIVDQALIVIQLDQSMRVKKGKTRK